MNVLIVEDSDVIRELAKITFEHYGCTVVEARDGQKGLDLARLHKPDLIISDALMPRMDGFQLLRALKTDPILNAIPFIFYSEIYTGEEEAELALSLGADAFIIKPIEPAQLWEKTCTVMKERETHKRKPVHTLTNEDDEQYLREYSRIVATKLEEKVHELEEALDLRRQAEEELRILNTGLEARITKEVEKNRKKDHVMAHQARLAAMGEMLSNIAHQWRQPLNNISLIVQNFLQEFESGTLDHDSCRDDVRECMGQLAYLSRTIDNFSEFYHPAQARGLFALCPVITDTIALVAADFKSHGIAIETVNELDSFVDGYRNEFCQVLLNIIINAKEALLSRQTPSPTVRIVCSQKEQAALVTVSDNGGYVAPELLDKFFDPYFTTKFRSQGTGMGLYIAKMIIDKHMGGSITATSTAAGTEVSIELVQAVESSN